MELEKVDSSEQLAGLFTDLGYKTLDVAYSAEQLELPGRACELLSSGITLVSDYRSDGSVFRIWHAELTKLTRTDFRTILQPYYRRYPHQTLFVFTGSRYSNLCFVSPQRVPGPEIGQFKLRLRVLKVDREHVYHTDREVVEAIRLVDLVPTPDQIWQRHLEAFNVQRVTDRFFDDYKKVLDDLKADLSDRYNLEARKSHAFAQQLLNRLMFIYFLQKMEWLKWPETGADKRYMRTLWHKYLDKVGGRVSRNSTDFYDLWLDALFFEAFNQPPGAHVRRTGLPAEVAQSFTDMPYLNGGLFQPRRELDDVNVSVADEFFEAVFDTNTGLLETYNFTVDESTLLDVEVAVDPEMLGTVYESLIAEEERHAGGIFYTPREEISYMCRLSLTEYLHESTGLSKDLLIPLVMEPTPPLQEDPTVGPLPSPAEPFSDEQLRTIQDKLRGVRVLDPAVGSASFLVGMMNVLVELHEVIAERLGEAESLNRFALKKEVIRRNLFGVDVRDWAVRAGELRLWLSLIVESEEREMDRFSPLLPNFSFRLRQGDSLIEEIGGIRPTFLRETHGLSAADRRIRNRILELAEKKARFFSGERGLTQEAIEKEQADLLRRLLDRRVKDLQDQIARYKDRGTAAEGERLRALRQERDELKKLALELPSAAGAEREYFLWEVEFAEVFDEKGGFDIVIGNPPYIRQEQIAPLLLDAKDVRPAVWRMVKRGYKERLEADTLAHWPQVGRIDKRSDIYVYFYYHALDLLRPGGVFCFINSNAWLDVGYGTGLQEFLLGNMKVLQVIDNHARRSFKHSDVNTVIVLIQRPEKDEEVWHNVVRFAAYKKPFEEAVGAATARFIEQTTIQRALDEGGNVRAFPMTQAHLRIQGTGAAEKETEPTLTPDDYARLPYAGGKWGGRYLRAPDIFFTIMEKAKGKLVRLGDIAEVRRGFTTGCNDFFYLPSRYFDLRDAGDVYELIPKQPGLPDDLAIEKEFLKPVIKTPRELSTVLVRAEDLKLRAFLCRLERNELSRRHAYHYVLWGESESFHLRPTAGGADDWYAISKEPADILWWKSIGERYGCFYNPELYPADQRNYFVFAPAELKLPLLVLANSTVDRLLIEAIAREMTGALTIIELSVESVRSKEMLSPGTVWRGLNVKTKDGAEEVFEGFCRRPLTGIFSEVGLPKAVPDYSNIGPADVRLDGVLPDRRALDEVVFDVLGLTEAERLEVYRAVVDLVKNRLTKAQSIRS